MPNGKAPPLPPLVTFREEPAGRETLAAIAEARGEVLTPRQPASTQIYGDRISNAPGAVSPKTSRALDDAPELTVSFLPAGRATHAVISHELSGRNPSIEVHETGEEEEELTGSWSTAGLSSVDVEKVHTFLVHLPKEHLDAPHVRRWLLTHRLLPAATPGTSQDDVTRITVEAQGPAACWVRFWTRVR